ncbi:O-antigen ligase [Caloramator quimbayensis]|uniref:O-antigen ligase n=1 Tax=Caloramator quimbayensis TaxID=1147123 RepID=A0A1T4YD68_9CLOT|nr:O-antigen ligase family protein [Caloramator quimbayensis]SKA99650.1 O-antigen ligase [Caloramator quimbayensis]
MFASLLLIVISPYTAFIPVIYISYLMIKGKYTLKRNPWNGGLLVLFVWSFIVGIINKSLLSSLLSLAFLLYFCLSVFIENQYNSEYKIEGLLKLLLKISVFSAVLGILEKISFAFWSNPLWAKLIMCPPWATKNHRVYSTFGNPNVAGAWFSCMILLCIYFLNKSGKKRNYLYYIALSLFITALILTGSRGAAIGLLSGVFVYFSLNKNKQSFRFLLLASLIIGIIMYAPSIVPSLKNIFGHELDNSIDSRQAIWDGCYKMFQLKPLTGWGLLGVYDYGTYFINYHLREVHAHNIWITIATTLGIVGLTVFIYMKMYIFEGIRLLYNENCKLVSLLSAIQAAILVHGIVDFTIMAPQMGIMFIISSSMISSLSMQYSDATVNNPVPAYNSLL